MCKRITFCVLFAAMAVTVAAAPLYAITPQLFNSSESPSTNLSAFPKWKGALDRYQHKEEESQTETCDNNNINHCQLTEWYNFLDTLRDKDLKTQLDEINRYMNEAEYIIDPINWGVPDYWAAPHQFFIKDGDCEDYAIAKFISLRKLGVPNEAMRISVVRDENLNIIHSVLAVYDNDTIYILDNQISAVMEDKRIYHYRPIYSINETTWWRHR